MPLINSRICGMCSKLVTWLTKSVFYTEEDSEEDFTLNFCNFALGIFKLKHA